jgi:hypothetical protein
MARRTTREIPRDGAEPVRDRTRKKTAVGARVGRTRGKRIPAVETDRSHKLVKVAVGDWPVFPYLVIRLMAAVYVNEKIHVGPWPPVNRKPGWIVVVHPDPWEDGHFRPEVRQAVIDQVIARCRAQKSFRMCIVFSKDEQVFVEPDGSFKVEHDKVPSMSFPLIAGATPASLIGLPIHRLPDEGRPSGEVPE